MVFDVVFHGSDGLLEGLKPKFSDRKSVHFLKNTVFPPLYTRQKHDMRQEITARKSSPSRFRDTGFSTMMTTRRGGPVMSDAPKNGTRPLRLTRQFILSAMLNL